MYKISFDTYYQMLTWDEIYWGIKKDLIEPESAIDYANKLIENNSNDDNPLLIELFILENINKNEVLALLDTFLPETKSQEGKSVKILRYVILDNIRKANKNSQRILNDIESVYADFDYPADMNSFISYMPPEDDDYNPEEHTEKENIRRLMEKFAVFLETERRQIEKR